MLQDEVIQFTCKRQSCGKVFATINYSIYNQSIHPIYVTNCPYCDSMIAEYNYGKRTVQNR